MIPVHDPLGIIVLHEIIAHRVRGAIIGEDVAGRFGGVGWVAEGAWCSIPSLLPCNGGVRAGKGHVVLVGGGLAEIVAPDLQALAFVGAGGRAYVAVLALHQLCGQEVIEAIVVDQVGGLAAVVDDQSHLGVPGLVVCGEAVLLDRVARALVTINTIGNEDQARHLRFRYFEGTAGDHLVLNAAHVDAHVVLVEQRSIHLEGAAIVE